MSFSTRRVAVVAAALAAVTCGVDLAPLERTDGGSGATGTGASGGDASSTTGGNAGDAGGIDAVPDTGPLGCTECFANVCTAEYASCQANPDCKKVATCMSGCATPNCEASCLNNAGLDGGVIWYTYSSCLAGKCQKECGLLGVPGSVGCVKSTCTLPGQKCCMNPLLLQYGGASCVASGASCDGEAMLRCDGPEDCPGQKCCATYQQSGIGLKETKCQDSCASNLMIVCGATPSACPSGFACVEGPLRLCQGS